MSTHYLGSLSQPYTGKAFKESMVSCLDTLVNQPDAFLDVDGKRRVHLKFANGRAAIVELLQEDQEFEEAKEPLLVHEVKYQQLRAHWTTISAAVVFGIGFSFVYKTDSAESVRLVLYKSESHPSDDFVEGIVAEMQASLEYNALGEMSDRMEAGFKRLEKLINRK
ncbi:hypothetical protein [Comamonas thiooxydans]|uniref:hypothetical protein n=1 Tax=Comamonas thiooxydans TaxID=363952 RepID=UPI0013D9383F|nr:hypothetical protein [Comamonas thiooxydans]